MSISREAKEGSSNNSATDDTMAGYKRTEIKQTTGEKETDSEEDHSKAETSPRSVKDVQASSRAESGSTKSSAYLLIEEKSVKEEPSLFSISSYTSDALHQVSMAIFSLCMLFVVVTGSMIVYSCGINSCEERDAWPPRGGCKKLASPQPQNVTGFDELATNITYLNRPSHNSDNQSQKVGNGVVPNPP